MKIGYDAKRVFHNFRGLGSYSRNLLEGMGRFYPGHEYILYSPSFTDKRAKDWYKKKPFRVSTPKNLLFKTFPSLWRSFFIGNDLNDVDVYHGLSHELPIGIKSDITRVVTIHDLIFMRHPSWFPLLDRIIYKRKVIHSCQNADLIIAISEQTKADIVDFLKIQEDKIQVIPPHCHPRFYEKCSGELTKKILEAHPFTSPYLLYVGAIEERKNPLTLIEAFYHLSGKYNLVLVGTGNRYKKKVLEKIKHLNLQDRIFMLENITAEELPVLYEQAELFIYPSLFEGFGIPIAEAIASGTPVITSKGSCFSEVGGPSSIYVNPLDSEEMAVEMDRVLSNKNLSQKMSEEGKKHARRFHWEKTSYDMMNAYLKAIAR